MSPDAPSPPPSVDITVLDRGPGHPARRVPGLSARRWADLLLRGQIFGKLDCQGSCWSTFYFDGFYSKSDLEVLGKGFGSVTLHVQASDLPAGKHAGVGSWRTVIVGDKIWDALAR